MSTFNPDGIGIANGNLFGFPGDEITSDIIIIPVPWDVTASYGKGTSQGPKAILDASTQLDFFHPNLRDAALTKVFMTPISKEWEQINERLSLQSVEYIQYLESGSEDLEPFKPFLNEVNQAQNALKNNLKERSIDLLKKGKIVAVLGGEHSTPLGLIEALNEIYDNFGIIQIDAHADLRNSYENFKQSHASIMFNVLESCQNMSKLVQVGIRDIAESEVELINNSEGRINTFFDWDIKQNFYNGLNWDKQTDNIISDLPQHVYISFDIDGLKPFLCPNTGTPVPGGFELDEVTYLLFKIIDSGRKIIGFDLNEVSPGSNGDWDANVGARAFWNLICVAEKSRRQHEN